MEHQTSVPGFAHAELDLEAAVAHFAKLPAALQIGSLHPRFVAADATRDNSVRPVYWLYDEGPVLLHSFHLGRIDNTGLCDVQSAYGYGGPLASSDDPQFLARAAASFLSWARARGVVAEFLRFHPVADNQRFHDGPVREERDTVTIDLTQDLFAQYQSRRRSYVRSALRGGLRCEFVDAATMLRTFPEIYAQNMHALRATPFYFFPQQYFERMLSLDFVRGILAYDAGGQAVAGLILTAHGANVEYHLAAALPDAPTLATTLLIHSVAAHYQEAGAESFYLGGGRSAGEDDSLLFFKRSFSRTFRKFRIGLRVLEAAAYDRLKVEFRDRFEANPGRLLFYR
jgi:hypothetical protein